MNLRKVKKSDLWKKYFFLGKERDKSKFAGKSERVLFFLFKLFLQAAAGRLSPPLAASG